MIGKITAPHGEHVEPLIYYLFDPERYEEHTDLHVVAGWRHPAELEPPLREDDAGGLPVAALAAVCGHGQLRLSPAGMALLGACRSRRHELFDDEWAQIACDVMDRTGLAPYDQEDAAVRWIAVRDGDDRIHIVAMLAREDSVDSACTTAGTAYAMPAGPPSSGTDCGPPRPADRTAARRPSRAETGRSARLGLGEALRVTLRRQVTTAARGGGQRGAVLRPPRPGRGAGPQEVQRAKPRLGHRVRGRPAWRYGQGWRTGVVRAASWRPT